MDFIDKGILVLATMEMANRKKEEAFYPSEVVQWVFPNDWENFLDDENEAVDWLCQNGFITFENEGRAFAKSIVDGVDKIRLC